MRSNNDLSKRPIDPIDPRDHSYRWVRGLDSVKASFDDRALSVFQADILTSEQYLRTYKRKIPLAPERALMFAVLQDAVVCFQECVGAQNKRKRRLFLDAEEWILSRDSFYLFSFENVCASLGFDSGYLRRGLMCWKNKTLGLNHRQAASQGADRTVQRRFGHSFSSRDIGPRQFLNIQLLRVAGADYNGAGKYSRHEPFHRRAPVLSEES